jgi:hypothetical protein
MTNRDMIEHDDGSVSIGELRFVPLMVRMKGDLEPVPGVFAIPGGTMATKSDLPEIARRIQSWMEGMPWM